MASTSLTRILLRPSVSSLAESTASICLSCQRHQSSYRRTRKALNVKPAPSFVPSTSETQDHIIFNPPSSLPSVYHTPPLFLPAHDPRRKFHARFWTKSTAQSSSSSTAAPAPGTVNSSLVPAVRPEYQKKYHLTQEQIEEIRRLRKEDPRKWTRLRLAEKFECSQFFISLCCSSPEMKARQERALEEVKKKWGRRKTEAREARQVRKRSWGTDA